MTNKYLIIKRLIQKTSIIFILTIIFISCGKSEKTPPIDNSIDLDGTQINDSSLTYPERFLLSVKSLPQMNKIKTPLFLFVYMDLQPPHLNGLNFVISFIKKELQTLHLFYLADTVEII